MISIGYFTTVLGDLDIQEMKNCQPHEHVYIVETEALLIHEELRINNMAASIKELRMLKAVGGATVVDANPLATGRDAQALKTISEQSGIQIIATTGYHLPFFYPAGHWIWTADEEALYQLFLREIREGMYLGGHYSWPEVQTDIRAGLIKAALTDAGVSGRTELLLRAAGQAAADGDMSLMLHTEYGKGALDAIRLLTDQGVPKERILICHVDRQAEDYGIHEEIAAAGVFMEYDTITLFEFHDNQAELKLLRNMQEKGYWDQILISTDPTADRLKSYGGAVGMDYLQTVFFEKMRNSGFTDQMIRTISEINPARALGRGLII